jgi:hypothetical protein
MKLVQTLLALVVITGIAAGIALAGSAQKVEKTAAACCSVESCCEKADCCEVGNCCDAKVGCQSATCDDCGKTAASCHDTTPAVTPVAKSCCSK